MDLAGDALDHQHRGVEAQVVVLDLHPGRPHRARLAPRGGLKQVDRAADLAGGEVLVEQAVVGQAGAMGHQVAHRLPGVRIGRHVPHDGVVPVQAAIGHQVPQQRGCGQGLGQRCAVADGGGCVGPVGVALGQAHAALVDDLAVAHQHHGAIEAGAGRGLVDHGIGMARHVGQRNRRAAACHQGGDQQAGQQGARRHGQQGARSAFSGASPRSAAWSRSAPLRWAAAPSNWRRRSRRRPGSAAG
jgi:hypothetical protein